LRTERRRVNVKIASLRAKRSNPVDKVGLLRRQCSS
jgi:hypothetical protein